MSLRVIRAGIFDTIQDDGRYHYRHLGINLNGPVDRFSAQLANALLGKELSGALIEIHFPASAFRFETATVICITGADFSPTVNNLPLTLHQPVYVPAGSIVEFKKPEHGSWCYMAVLHQFQLDAWLGSYSTNTKVNAGGYDGRTLKQDDVLSFQHDPVLKFRSSQLTKLNWHARDVIDLELKEIEFIKGNEWSWLTKDSCEFVQQNFFAVSRLSDRMGYRLEGHSLFTKINTDVVSSAVCAGTIQLLPSGQMIILMADHQTTGGYPRLGYITSVYLPVLAQKQPGSFIRLKPVFLQEAEEKFIERQHYLAELKMVCEYKIKNVLHAFM